MIDVSVCKQLGPLSLGGLGRLCEEREDYRELLVRQALARGLIGHRDVPLVDADPGPFRRAANFAAAWTRHLADGVRRVPLEVYESRRAACNDCLYRDPLSDQCRNRKCGCNLETGPTGTPLEGKLWWASESCPLAVPRWGRHRRDAVVWPVHFDEVSLCPEHPGLRFNSSIIPWHAGYLLAYRTGWEGSEICLAGLDREFRPTGFHKPLPLYHRDAAYGREDPRLFLFRGKLHVMFIGVMADGFLRTNVLYARLGDDFRVEAVHHPHYIGRQMWEKNWQFFEHDEELYAAYTIAPHKILRVRGDHAELAYESPMVAPWSGGEMRGGAAPVRVGDEFYCFFHGRTGGGPQTVYNAGLYTFEAKPPFRVMRFTPEPLLVADPTMKPADQWASVVFPCGAARVGPAWVLSCGIHDRWTELHALDASELERKLVPVRPPAWFTVRDEVDEGTFSAVARDDEYRVGGMEFGPRDAVIDVGAHIGSFALTAWRRGCRMIHCYEPWAGNHEALRRNLMGLPGTVLYPEAMGGGLPLFYHPHATGNSNVGRCTPEPGEEPVASVTLDRAMTRMAPFLADGGQIALIKLDCEGAEGDILATADLTAVRAVCGECHPFLGCPPEAVRGPLEAAGFVVEFGPEQGEGAMLFWASRPPGEASQD